MPQTHLLIQPKNHTTRGFDAADVEVPARSQQPAPSLTQARNVSSLSIASTGSTTSFSPRLKYAFMAEHLHQAQLRRRWIINHDSTTEGVFVRIRQGEYEALPQQHEEDSELYKAIVALNTPAAMTITTPVIQKYLEHHPHATEVPSGKDLRTQVVATYSDLRRAKVHQYAAFVASHKVLVVWDDQPLSLEARAGDILANLTTMVWGDGLDSVKLDDDVGGDKEEEVDQAEPGKRKINLINAILVGMTLCFIAILFGAGWRALATECAIDGHYLRLALILLAPVHLFFSLFFAQAIIGCFAQIIGPIAQMKHNSRFYSATCVPRLRTSTLPHITIQCPVYKEDLAATIAPTIRSIKAAISTYELQGGTANLFINDDGLQSIPQAQREARIRFYSDNNIGWTARPNHGAVLRNGSTFVKRGKFKKASNMNYGLHLSCLIEDRLSTIHRPPTWTQADESAAYDAAFKTVMEDQYPDAWAAGDIRVGDYILLVDSDTRIPTDCFLDAVSEMEASPEVGILQFSSGVMQVQHDYFENGITFFTDLIYSAIRYTVANGDVAPFVGHNAMVRWSAIQNVAFPSPFPDDEEGRVLFWSESHVSEDFDMALRLQCQGYIIRLAAWAGDGFKEGVSLTVYDELARWEKYAFGCNELLFYPLAEWWRKGPFTPIFKAFLKSNIRLTSKVTILSYIGTYYAIGAAWVITIINYFLVGWFNGYLDHYYIDSWKVWFSLVIVFHGLGNVGLAAMRYRDEDTRSMSGGKKIAGFVGHLTTNFKHTFMLSIFLGGLSLHVSAALLSHMFGYNMTWGATSKEAKVTNFFQEAPLVIKRFKWSFLFSIGGFATMVILGTGTWGHVRHDYRITSAIAIVPMAMLLGSHLLLPIVLNPGLMVFSY